jgi:copper homeostasis protein (lipoprotein)
MPVAKTYFRAKGEGLEMLDREGNPIESQQLHACACKSGGLPPRRWRCGDVLLYGGCGDLYRLRNRQRSAVANNAQLERDYAVARGNDSSRYC